MVETGEDDARAGKARGQTTMAGVERWATRKCGGAARVKQGEAKAELKARWNHLSKLSITAGVDDGRPFGMLAILRRCCSGRAESTTQRTMTARSEWRRMKGAI
jgi:hypothetical protein